MPAEIRGIPLRLYDHIEKDGPDFDTDIFSVPRNRPCTTKYDLKSRFEPTSSRAANSEPHLGTLAVLPKEIRIEIWGYVVAGQTYSIDEDHRGNLVFYPECRFLNISKDLRPEVLYLWFNRASFEFRSPGCLTRFLTFLRGVDHPPKPINHVRIALLAPLGHVRLNSSDLKANDGPQTKALVRAWRTALSAAPSTLQTVLFDLDHRAIGPGSDLFGLIVLVATKMKMRSAKKSEVCLTGFAAEKEGTRRKWLECLK